MAVVSVTPPNQEVGLERKTLKALSKKVNWIMLSVFETRETSFYFNRKSKKDLRDL